MTITLIDPPHELVWAALAPDSACVDCGAVWPSWSDREQDDAACNRVWRVRLADPIDWSDVDDMDRPAAYVGAW